MFKGGMGMKQSKPGMGRHQGMSVPVEKAKNFKETLKRLLMYLKPRTTQLTFVAFFAILSTVFSIVSPKVLGKITTKLYEGFVQILNGTPNAAIDFNYVSKMLVILACLYGLSSFFSYIMQFIMAGVAQKTVFEMRKDVSNKLERLPLNYYDSHTHGEILSRVTNDIDNISTTLQQSLTQFITSIITIVGVIVMMLTISPIMTGITLLTLPLSLGITKSVATRSQKYYKKNQRILGELNGHVEEMYTGHQVVKSFNYEERSIKTFKGLNEKLFEAGWKSQFISGIIMPLMHFVNNIGFVLVSVVGGLLVIKQSFEVGNIQAFIQYSRQFGHPIVQTASIANVIQSTMASAERVFELLDEVEEIDDGRQEQVSNSIKGDIRFSNVDFSYKNDEKLIENLNIDVKSGENVAIVGPTGAGKTTLVNLLMRFYDINGGKITVDGKDIDTFKRNDLRKWFGMVLQDTWLYNGTIKDNIAYGNFQASEEDIINASKAAQAHYFIRTLPESYDTVINEEANNLSQGQKQLITIARAILSNPAMLILDEATSSVDTRTEAHIQKAMTELMKGRTSFVIAHRLSTIKNADTILVMKEGDIVEKGSHQELLDKEGFYADLYSSQFDIA